HDVLLACLQQMCGDLLALGDDFIRGLRQRGPADDKRARSIGAHAELHLVGIPKHDFDVFEPRQAFRRQSGRMLSREHAFVTIHEMLKEIAAPGNTFPKINFMFAVCGVLGGLVGSTILTFGLSLVCKEFGAFENWARVVMPGTVLGILLELSEKDDKLALHLGTLLPLF